MCLSSFAFLIQKNLLEILELLASLQSKAAFIRASAILSETSRQWWHGELSNFVLVFCLYFVIF